MAIEQATLEKYWRLQDKAKAEVMPYKTDKSGRGIVICGGGKKYFTCAWVCINVLRRLGCNLPIELWHLGSTEMDDKMRELVAPLNVTCVDAYDVRARYPVRILHGWQLNPYSIIHSKFKEVIFLDADNVPLINPEDLFETPQYKETGAIFWPDYGRLASDREIWKLCRVEYRDEPEFESGQIVVDTERCWKELQLTMHLNEYSLDIYYDHVHGDKETFHMAWHMWGTPYSMPSKGITPLNRTMCQHDFDGNRIFQHRNMDKWKLDGGNLKIRGFRMEDLCLGFVRELKAKWDGKVSLPQPKTETGRQLEADILRLKNFRYSRVGFDDRELEILPGNEIGKGSAKLEQRWYIREIDGKTHFCIIGEHNLTCALFKGTKNMLQGRWESFERMPIEFAPTNGEFTIGPTVLDPGPDLLPGVSNPQPSPEVTPEPTVTPAEAATHTLSNAVPVAEEVVAAAVEEFQEKHPGIPLNTFTEEALHHQTFVYVRVGYDSRLMKLGVNGTFSKGGYSLENSWSFEYEGQIPTIVVKDYDGAAIFRARRGIDGVWRGKWNRFERMDVMLVEVPR